MVVVQVYKYELKLIDTALDDTPIEAATLCGTVNEVLMAVADVIIRNALVRVQGS